MNNVERYKIILDLRSQKKTLQEIGDIFSISRERVRQIITGPTEQEIKKREERRNQKMLLLKKRAEELQSILERSRKDLEKKREETNKILRNKTISINTKPLNITEITGLMHGTRDRNRELIRIRDQHTCQICGKVWEVGQRRFDVHHIDEDNTKTLKTDNLEIEAKNMITLCHKCHLNLPGHKIKMSDRRYPHNI